MPHTKTSTEALKKLLVDEGGTRAERLTQLSLPKGSIVEGFSPAPGVADHLLVFNNKIPETVAFKTEVIPKTTVPNSEPSTFEISARVPRCLSQKIDNETNAYLIHMSFLNHAKQKTQRVVQEEVMAPLSHKL
jgi:hypothetical protein